MRVPSIFNRRGLPWAVSGNGYYGTTVRWDASSRALPYGHTHSRSGIGWCWNSSGYLVAPENLLTYSNDPSNANWVDIGGCTTAQNVTGPSGQANYAWTLTDAGNTNRYKQQRFVALNKGWHVYSARVKKTTGAQASYPVLMFTDDGFRMAAVTIDTSNGVATKWTAYTGWTILTSAVSITDEGNGFLRVQLKFEHVVATGLVYLFPAGTTNATQSTGTVDTNAQGSAVFCDTMLQRGYYATDYLPTTSAGLAAPCFETDPADGKTRLLVRGAEVNSIPYSEDLLTAPWVPNVGAASAKNATGLSGQPNGAWTLVDDNAGSFLNVAGSVAVPNDSNKHYIKIWIAKTSGGTSKTFGVNAALTGGTPVSATPRVNTDTGVDMAATAAISDEGLWWGVTIGLQNNSTGNTLLSLAMYPAVSGNGVFGDVVTTTGSCVIGAVMVALNPYSQGVAGYVRTLASPTSTGEDDLRWDNTVYPFLALSTGSCAVKVKHIVTPSAVQAGLLSAYNVGGGPIPMYFHHATSDQASIYDTTTVLDSLSWSPTRGQQSVVSTTWGDGRMMSAVNGVVGVSGAFDGSMLSGAGIFRWGNHVDSVGVNQPMPVAIESIHLGRAKLSPALLANAIR